MISLFFFFPSLLSINLFSGFPEVEVGGLTIGVGWRGL